MAILIDFDGTITDVDKEAMPYKEVFRRSFCKRMGIIPEALDPLIERYGNAIRADPAAGWEFAGHIVAPATADPYMINNAVFTTILAETFQIRPQQRDKIMYDLHTQAYEHAGTHFREGAKELLDSIDAIIITNSKPDAVLRKLAQLGSYDIQVLGDAKKYIIDQSWSPVPAAVRPQGFPRDVLLRRRHYAEALQKAQVDAVLGDVYELDLALPEYLGHRVIQLETPGMQPHEREHMKGRTAASLHHALTLL
jgi:hypothetical protein